MPARWPSFSFSPPRRWPAPRGRSPSQAAGPHAERQGAGRRDARAPAPRRSRPAPGDLLRAGHRRQRQSSVTIKGATALGLLAQAAKSDRGAAAASRHRPLQLQPRSGALRGRRQPPDSGRKASWYLTVNHKSPPLGGSKVKLHAGRRSALVPGDRLPLPRRAGAERPGRGQRREAVSRCASSPITKRASASRPPGSRSPAPPAPTGLSGRAMVTLGKPAAAGRPPRHRHSVQPRGRCALGASARAAQVGEPAPRHGGCGIALLVGALAVAGCGLGPGKGLGDVELDRDP